MQLLAEAMSELSVWGPGRAMLSLLWGGGRGRLSKAPFIQPQRHWYWLCMAELFYLQSAFTGNVPFSIADKTSQREACTEELGDWIWISAWPLGWVRTFLQCSGTSHPHLKLEDNNTYHTGLLLGLNAIIYVTCLAQCLANEEHLIQFHFYSWYVQGCWGGKNSPLPL